MGRVTDESGRPAGQVGIGVVVPYDFALDRELWRWTPERVALHLTRTPYEDIPVGVEQALTVGDATTVAGATRSVTIVEPAVIAYGCTSGSFVTGRRGEAALREAMLAAGASRAVTTSGALLRAVETLGIDSLAVVTPYPDEVGDRLVAFLAEAGVKVTGSSNMGLTGRIWEVPDDVTADLVRSTARAGGDAVFVSCTNLPTYDVIAPLEEELGRPVLTANQVTMWAALLEAGVDAGEVDAGRQRLFAS
jgi:maleate isomerase